jgi:hypothetical protein
MVLCNHSQLLSQSSHVCFIDFSSVDYVQKMFLRLYTYIIIYIYTQNIDDFQDVGTQLRLINRPSCASHSLAGKKMAAVQVFVHETTLSACKERIC